MICKCCGRKFFIRRELLKLFAEQKAYLCDSCYRRYPLALRLQQIPLTQYHCYILTMFSEYPRVNVNFYAFEYSRICRQFMGRKNYFFLFLNSFSLSDEAIEVLDAISLLNRKNLFILTPWLKN